MGPLGPNKKQGNSRIEKDINFQLYAMSKRKLALGKKGVVCECRLDKQNTSLTNPPRKSIDSTARVDIYCDRVCATYPVFCFLFSTASCLSSSAMFDNRPQFNLFDMGYPCKVQYNASRSKGRVQDDAVRSMPLLYLLLAATFTS